MKIHELSPVQGATKKRKRVGRGPGSGHGKTACRGHKGQRARAGGGNRPGFEGGQMPLQRRLPKRGFTNLFKEEYNVVNTGDLVRFGAEATLDMDVLKEAGLIRRKKARLKLLAKGEITQPVTIKVHKASKAAREKVEAAGGKVEIL